MFLITSIVNLFKPSSHIDIQVSSSIFQLKFKGIITPEQKVICSEQVDLFLRDKSVSSFHVLPAWIKALNELGFKAKTKRLNERPRNWNHTLENPRAVVEESESESDSIDDDLDDDDLDDDGDDWRSVLD